MVHQIAEMIARTYSPFDQAQFLATALEGFDDLELTGRARHVSAALAETLPTNREAAIKILIACLGPEIGESDLKGMEVFLYLPFVYFVATEGMECYDISMEAQYELTKRFTAEFSIRAFIEDSPAKTLNHLRAWAEDPNVHVRRLVSEGTRPRLPWAGRLREFQRDPTPVLELLELLKDDPEEYVRRSVANNLNDIAKDHPDVVVEVARRWWTGASTDRKRLIRHGLRTLIKAGHPGALDILGYGESSPVRVTKVRCEPATPRIGERVRVTIDLENPSTEPGAALVDFVIHFVKASGETSPKVFKGSEVELAAGTTTSIKKTVSLKQHTTRKHYPGPHRVAVQLNGRTIEGGRFDLRPAQHAPS